MGDRVRARAGSVNPEQPERVIGGWTGTIVELDVAAPARVLVAWDASQYSPAWLDQNDLEPASGSVIPIDLSPGRGQTFHWSVTFGDERQLFPSDASRPHWGVRLVRFGVYGCLSGAILGGVLRAVEGASTAVAVGATVFGVLGWLTGARFGWFIGQAKRLRLAALLGGLCGMSLGALFGAFVGAAASTLIAGYKGALIGMVLGMVLASMGSGPGAGCVRPFAGAIVGLMVGPCLETIYRNPDAALLGAGYGAGIGATVAALLYLGLWAAVVRLRR